MIEILKNLTYSTLMLVLIACITVPFFAWSSKAALTKGSKAPNFSLMGDDGKTYKLSNYADQKVVLYFYPYDNSPHCTAQACSLARGFATLEENSITIFGINYQSPKEHAQFKKKHNLPFILLSDADKSVADAYGAYSRWHFFFPKRITILIDKGVIVKTIENIDLNKHADQILKEFGI